jgi:predicted MFS family arabinose efflux permease
MATLITMARVDLHVRGSFACLAEPGFRNLYLARAVSVLGDGLVPVALAFGVLQTRNSASALGIVLACRFVSLVGLMPVSGVIADRLPRRAILICSDALRFVVQAAMAALLITRTAQVWQLAALTLLYGVGNAFFLPTSTGIVPQTVSAGRLQQANALIAMTQSAFSILGPAMAGAMVVTVGAGWTFVIDAASFAVSAGFTARLPKIAASARGTESFVTDLRLGWREFRARSWICLEVVYGALAALIVLAPFQVLGPVLAKNELGGASAWAAVVASFGAGSLTGGLMLLRVSPRKPLTASVLMLSLMALPAVILALPGRTVWIAAAAFAGGTGFAFYNAIIETTVQRTVPANVLSRIASIDWMLSNSLLPLGATAAGLVAALVGTRAVFFASAAWLVISSAAMLISRPVRTFQLSSTPVGADQKTGTVLHGSDTEVAD